MELYLARYTDYYRAVFPVRPEVMAASAAVVRLVSAG
jgi:hypothetical protein